ncbi:MAG: type II secretion system inner membrane protein GspF [Deltaproteobacteria bacterium]|nr:type II secretion system inner membrane protein GspF [Deltaproteobacteria bacterium]
MPVYEYTAIDGKGKTTSGIIDAESAPAARQRIRDSGEFPVSIKETDDTPGRGKHKAFFLGRPFTHVKPSEVSMMTRQLATLVGAGFPLVTAFDTLIPQTKSRKLKKMLSQIKESIVEGNSFADALSPYPVIFSSVYVNMVRSGESSGTLDVVLDRLADITEKQQALMNRIRTAMVYPVFMTLIGIVILFFLLTFIVPSITQIFTDMNQILPAPTRFLIITSEFLKSYWWIIFIVAGGALLILGGFKKTDRGRYLIDRSILHLPGFGNLVKKLSIARFARTLGSLLENGVSMLTALEIVKNISGNVLIARAVEDASKEVGEGKGLGDALLKSKLFPNLFIQMIQVGEQSGQLESMLDKVADVFDNEVESTVMSLTSLLEPVMILVMGMIVGFIVLSICLPIFEMHQLVL